jgi:hypothetical protein
MNYHPEAFSRSRRRTTFAPSFTRFGGKVLISGQPEFCPDPVEVQIHGSTWGGAMIMNHYLGRGMHLEFWHPVHHIVITSRTVDIRETA